MEFRTAEEKLLHDYGVLEEENARLEDENTRLRARVSELEERTADIGEQACRIMAERDQADECIRNMVAIAGLYRPIRAEDGEPKIGGTE